MGLRFSVLYATANILLAAPTQTSSYELLPQAGRLQLELEMALSLSVAIALGLHFQRISRPLKAIYVLAMAIVLAIGYLDLRDRVEIESRPVSEVTRSEYQTAKWLDTQKLSGRVWAPGSHGFWLNAFSSVPQISGCCNQGRHALLTSHAHNLASAAESQADTLHAIAFLRALGAEIIVAPTAKSTEEYRDMRTPGKFGAVLPLAADLAGNQIYRIQLKNQTLAGAVSAESLVRSAHSDPQFWDELERYNTAYDASHTSAGQWVKTGRYRVFVRKNRDEVISTKISAAAGWRADVNGDNVPVGEDALGFLTVQTHCQGVCRLELEWDPSPSKRARAVLLSFGLIGLLLLVNPPMGFIGRMRSSADFSRTTK